MPITLKDLLDQLLRDVNRAQVASNSLTLEISKKYKDDPILQYLPIPNAELSTLQLDLRYVYAPEIERKANDRAEVQKEVIQSDPLPSLARELVKSFSETAADQVERRAKDHKADNKTSLHKVLENLRGVSFQKHLVKQVEELLRSEISSLLEERVDVVVERVMKRLNDLLDKQIYCNSSITNYVGDGLNPLQEKRGLDTEASKRITSGFSQLAAHIKMLIEGDTLIIVDPAVLEEFPERAIQMLKININLRNYKWIKVESGDLKLLPE